MAHIHPPKTLLFKTGLVVCSYLGFLSVVTSRQNHDFVSHPDQKKVLKEATDAGCYIRVNAIVDANIEFTVSKDGIPILKDSRKSIQLEFISPHFTPWDELFDLQPDGSWKLKWNWRVSDIDGILAGRLSEVSLTGQHEANELPVER